MAKKKLNNKKNKDIVGKVKKPIYKKWWFWLIIIILVSPALINEDDSSKDNSKENITSENKLSESKDKKDKKGKDVKTSKAKESEVKTEVPYEIVDEIAVFTDDNDSIFSAKQHVDSFSAEMTKALKENHKDIKNGAIFRSVKTLSDKYGNEEKTNVLAVYYSPETIEKINYDKWPILDASGLYDTADTMWVHPAFKEKGAKENKSSTENAPNVYFNYLGSSAE